jgi:hypothetical protein
MPRIRVLPIAVRKTYRDPMLVGGARDELALKAYQ